MKNLIERIMRATTWQCQYCGERSNSSSLPPQKKCKSGNGYCVWRRLQ